MTDLKIDQDALATLVAKGILDGLTEDTREQVITDAIKAVVLTPSRDSYGRSSGPSPVQQAFEQAVRIALQQIVNERVLAADSDVRRQVEAAVDEFIAIFPESWREETTQQAVMKTVIEHFRDAKSGY